MKYLILVLLAALALTGCTPASSGPETTVPETAPTLETTLPAETAAAAQTTLPRDPLDLLLEHMTLEQKVGQLFICTPEQLLPDAGPISAMTDRLGEAISRYPVGGMILFADNILSPDQLGIFNQALQDASDIPLFLSVDEEGGIVARLANHSAFDLPRYQSAAAVGASENPEDARQMGRTIGAYLKAYGFNLDFAPVADVNTNPHNPVIGNRAFSADAVMAAEMAAAFAEGLREQGIIATFKHFPGHGDTAQDSHSGLAVTHRTGRQLANREIIPFLKAGSLDFIMVGHIAVPEETGDMTPASLSPYMVSTILKDNLEFGGLVITDAMNMGAITDTYTAGEAAVNALAAGCDIVLMPENLPEAFGAVLSALEEGRLTMQWLDETVWRILQFKQLHGILTFS